MKSIFHFGIKSLFFQLALTVGITFFLSFGIWGYFNIRYVRGMLFSNIISSADRLGNTVKSGLRHAMMHNRREDIQQIIDSIANQHVIRVVRIVNKSGVITFSSRQSDIEKSIEKKSRSCAGCHHQKGPPHLILRRDERVKVFREEKGTRLLHVTTPIKNEMGCAISACHISPSKKKVLGVLSVVISLKSADEKIYEYERKMILWIIFIFVVTVFILSLFFIYSVNIPIKRMIKGTKRIAKGNYGSYIDLERKGEMSQLADAINTMGEKIGEKQTALNRQRDEYRTLFELVPCLISVQDKNYRLIGYNREFEEKFDPKLSDRCYKVYKGREEKCLVCPVEQTFKDGRSHSSKETGVTKSGRRTHWIVRTAPIRDENGNIVAAMEMSLDVTEQKKLEDQLARSEKKYYEIFNNIPNPIFVLDLTTLKIIDCNESVRSVYGYKRSEILSLSFLNLFPEKERAGFEQKLKERMVFNQIIHRHSKGRIIYVNIRLSPSEYHGQKVLLATVNDITKRLETEQQLIQAGKMATLGEMATGVAHELNQPLSVIKTASSYFMRKVKKKEVIDPDILFEMSEEIDAHVERATKIINHMRQFGRKSDLNLESVQLNDILKSAFEIFSQQLKVRGISVHWDIHETIPEVSGDSSRLEQVFINLLINARDALEDRFSEKRQMEKGEKAIFLSSRCDRSHVTVTVRDTGVGIEKQYLEKVFEPFYTTKKAGKWTGLGLSISYNIVRECNGSIRAFSTPGKGTAFALSFPVKKPSGRKASY